MVTPELLSYIREQLAAGFTVEQLRPALEQAGWQADMITEAFAQIAAPAAATMPVAEPEPVVDTAALDAAAAAVQAAAAQAQGNGAGFAQAMANNVEATPATSLARDTETFSNNNTPATMGATTTPLTMVGMGTSGPTDLGAMMSPAATAAPVVRQKKKGGIGFFIEVFFLVLILAALCYAIYWVYNTGASYDSLELPGAVSNIINRG